MPYVKVKKFGSKYKVCDPEGKCLSKKPLSLEKAKKQELAVRLSTLRKEGKIPPRKNGKGFLTEVAKIFGDAAAKGIASSVNEYRDPKNKSRIDELKAKMKGKGMSSSYAMLPKMKCKF
jgi:hypothetical protein